jgi:hypothetical protein
MFKLDISAEIDLPLTLKESQNLFTTYFVACFHASVPHQFYQTPTYTICQNSYQTPSYHVNQIHFDLTKFPVEILKIEYNFNVKFSRKHYFAP